MPEAAAEKKGQILKQMDTQSETKNIGIQNN